MPSAAHTQTWKEETWIGPSNARIVQYSFIAYFEVLSTLLRLLACGCLRLSLGTRVHVVSSSPLFCNK